MFKFELRPEVRKELKDPDLFCKGMDKLHWGLIIAMSGVGLMLVLFFNKPEHVLHPTWLLFTGLVLCAWGEWQKYRAK